LDPLIDRRIGCNRSVQGEAYPVAGWIVIIASGLGEIDVLDDAAEAVIAMGDGTGGICATVRLVRIVAPATLQGYRGHD